jgi:pyridoxamine 5'-phosphate oxidase
MSETTSIETPLRPTSGDFTEAPEPLPLFAAWFEEAVRTELNDPNAMTLATTDREGIPNARIVLLKGFDERGFVFYTNLESRKGRELAVRPWAALVFHWKSLTRQVRMRGSLEPVGTVEADEYFAGRARQSQIGAWASRQSAPLAGRSVFEAALERYSTEYPGPVPRPPYWNGYRLAPRSIEFWHQRPFRLHDRIEFSRRGPGECWTKTRLYP